MTGLSGSCVVCEEFSSPLPPPSPDESSVLFSSVDPLPFAVSSWSSSFSRDNLVLKYEQEENQTNSVIWIREGHLGTVKFAMRNVVGRVYHLMSFNVPENWILTALAIRGSGSQNSLARWNFHSPRKVPHLHPKILRSGFRFTDQTFFSVSRNHGCPACHFVLSHSCFSPFMRLLLWITDPIYCLILVLIINCTIHISVVLIEKWAKRRSGKSPDYRNVLVLKRKASAFKFFYLEERFQN